MEKRYGWVIVAVGAVITCIAMGTMFALPVYLQPIADDTGWSRAGISGASVLTMSHITDFSSPTLSPPIA